MSSNAKSYADRAAAEPTDLHRNFAAWLKEQTGVDVDLKTVQLACSMRMDFQSSPENQTDLAKRKAAAVAKRKAEAASKKARLEAQLQKLQAELAKGDESDKGGPTVATKAAVKSTATSTPKAAASTPAETPSKAVDKPARTPRTRRATAAKATPAKTTTAAK
jgi:hypothetical protein